MVLYNRFKFQKNKKLHKKKSLDNPVVNSSEDLVYRQHNIDYLMNLKKQLEAREAKEKNLAFKRRLLEGQMKANYETEIARLKGEIHNPRIPDASVAHLKKKGSNIKRIKRIYFLKQYIKKNGS